MKPYHFLLLCSLLLCIACKPNPLNLKSQPHKIVVIAPDGFSAKILREHKDEFPNISRMMENGTSSLEVRSVLPSASALNWASMLTGSPPELNGYTTWDSKGACLERRAVNEYGKYPGIYGLLRQQRPLAVSGYFFEWPGMEFVYDHGSATEMARADKDRPDQTLERAKNFIRTKNPDLTFIYFDHPDTIGHAKGWESPEYLESCKTIDSYVGEIINEVNASPQAANTYVFFVSDHGGTGTKHGGKTMDEMQTPLVITGPDIRPNSDIRQSIMIYDIGSTWASILGLDQPQVWTGRPILLPKNSFRSK